MKTYTAKEVAAIVRLNYKSTLVLFKRGFLKALPGIRHKRVTEEELKRYLNKGFLHKLPQSAPAFPLPIASPSALGEPTKSAENNKPTKGKIK